LPIGKVMSIFIAVSIINAIMEGDGATSEIPRLFRSTCNEKERHMDIYKRSMHSRYAIHVLSSLFLSSLGLSLCFIQHSAVFLNHKFVQSLINSI
jgi:hypothetical protein